MPVPEVGPKIVQSPVGGATATGEGVATSVVRDTRVQEEVPSGAGRLAQFGAAGKAYQAELATRQAEWKGIQGQEQESASIRQLDGGPTLGYLYPPVDKAKADATVQSTLGFYMKDQKDNPALTDADKQRLGDTRQTLLGLLGKSNRDFGTFCQLVAEHGATSSDPGLRNLHVRLTQMGNTQLDRPFDTQTETAAAALVGSHRDIPVTHSYAQAKARFDSAVAYYTAVPEHPEGVPPHQVEAGRFIADFRAECGRRTTDTEFQQVGATTPEARQAYIDNKLMLTLSKPFMRDAVYPQSQGNPAIANIYALSNELATITSRPPQ